MNDVEKVHRFCEVLDNAIIRIGETMAWLNGLLIFVIITQVILRYVFESGSIKMEEFEWHLYSVNVVLGLGFAVAKNSHIRLDILSVHFSERTRQKVEIFGILFMLVPFIAVFLITGFDFWLSSLEVKESSINPMGLCCRYIIKGFIPFGGVLLAAASVSRLIRAFAYLRANRKAKEE
jgi:TRAP-type mannitol/chloroaromatic compound transport system permease small subunit